MNHPISILKHRHLSINRRFQLLYLTFIDHLGFQCKLYHKVLSLYTVLLDGLPICLSVVHDVTISKYKSNLLQLVYEVPYQLILYIHG
jgi:hypothetical protein